MGPKAEWYWQPTMGLQLFLGPALGPEEVVCGDLCYSWSA